MQEALLTLFADDETVPTFEPRSEHTTLLISVHNNHHSSISMLRYTTPCGRAYCNFFNRLESKEWRLMLGGFPSEAKSGMPEWIIAEPNF
jgi:hypothetical protein